MDGEGLVGKRRYFEVWQDDRDIFLGAFGKYDVFLSSSHPSGRHYYLHPGNKTGIWVNDASYDLPEELKPVNAFIKLKGLE